MKEEVLPPWVTHPAIPYPSIGRNMGVGQDTIIKFWGWFSFISNEHAADVELRYPEPEAWRGKYAQVRANPWKQDDE